LASNYNMVVPGYSNWISSCEKLFVVMRSIKHSNAGAQLVPFAWNKKSLPAPWWTQKCAIAFVRGILLYGIGQFELIFNSDLVELKAEIERIRQSLLVPSLDTHSLDTRRRLSKYFDAIILELKATLIGKLTARKERKDYIKHQ